MKVTVVGAGNVGATCAQILAIKEICSEVVLLDIKEGLAEGKVLDIYQCSTLMDFDTKLTGVTNDYSATAGSDVVVITSGIPRKPGMTREELIGTNASIVKEVTMNCLKHSPKAIILIVSNPMDTMTYLALKSSGLPKNQLFGMGGALDSARFKCYLAKALGVNINDIDCMVIGGHGDTTMIPLISKTSIKGVPVTDKCCCSSMCCDTSSTCDTTTTCDSSCSCGCKENGGTCCCKENCACGCKGKCSCSTKECKDDCTCGCKDKCSCCNDKLSKVVADTMVGGATLTKFLGTSAWYAPGAAAAMVVESIVKDQKKIIPSCVFLDGEYGQSDICIGVPTVIGRQGAEKIVTIPLTADEKVAFAKSADAVRSTNDVLKEIKAL